MKFISLFAGVGGFDLALERLGHECVYANDIDKYCKIVYDHNFLHNRGLLSKEDNSIQRTVANTKEQQDRIKSYDYKQYGLDNRSITDVTTDEIPDHELLVGGFPCPSFSIAGKRKGLEDVRGQLIFDIIRILRVKKPKMFLLENVKGLLSHDKGNTMEIICEELCESGYAIDFEVLNSKNFGVPQSRERVFIIGKRLDTLDSCQVF